MAPHLQPNVARRLTALAPLLDNSVAPPGWVDCAALLMAPGESLDGWPPEVPVLCAKVYGATNVMVPDAILMPLLLCYQALRRTEPTVSHGIAHGATLYAALRRRLSLDAITLLTSTPGSLHRALYAEGLLVSEPRHAHRMP